MSAGEASGEKSTEGGALRVGVVCFPKMGGSGVVASAQAAALAARGHQVHLFSSRPPARPLPPCERLTFHAVQAFDYPLFEQAPYTVALASSLADVVRAESLQVLHVHYAVPHAVSAYLARQILLPQAPRIVTSLHGTDVLSVGIHPAYRTATVFAVAASDGIIVPSDYLRREAYRLFGLPADLGIEVLPNFVDVHRFKPASVRTPRAEPVLIHVSNFRPVKRVPDTVEVLARVRRAMPARLVLIGDGPERLRVESRARALGVEHAVTFLGNQNDFEDELAQADVFLLPSESESFGVAALEALSAGVPVVGYEVGGVPELVTPEVGTLVPMGDVEALARAVVELLSSQERQRTLRQNARARVLGGFQVEPAIEQYERYLRAVISRPGKGHG